MPTMPQTRITDWRHAKERTYDTCKATKHNTRQFRRVQINCNAKHVSKNKRSKHTRPNRKNKHAQRQYTARTQQSTQYATHQKSQQKYATRQNAQRKQVVNDFVNSKATHNNALTDDNDIDELLGTRNITQEGHKNRSLTHCALHGRRH